MKLAITVFSSLFILVCTHAAVRKLNGIEFPENQTITKKPLVLNGLGMRLATIFDVKVYVGALYLEEKNTNAQAILNSDQVKHIEMVFLRDVDGQDLRDGFEDGFSSNKLPKKTYENAVKKLYSLLKDTKEGQRLKFTFTKDSVFVAIHNNHFTEIVGKEFSRDLLKLWLNQAPNNELKTGLLGL